MNNKKAVSPILAVMILVAVAFAAVGAYFMWYKAFQNTSSKVVDTSFEIIDAYSHSGSFFLIVVGDGIPNDPNDLTVILDDGKQGYPSVLSYIEIYDDLKILVATPTMSLEDGKVYILDLYYDSFCVTETMVYHRG